MTKIALLLMLAIAAPASAEIFKCQDEEGNVAYLDTPCPEAKRQDAEPVKQADAAADERVDEAAADDAMPAAEMKSLEEIEACKEPLRDSIDAIEGEMLRGYTAEEGEAFKQRLRVLTQKMRACGYPGRG